MARAADPPDLPPPIESRSRLLQVGSPECITGEMNYLKGANPGDFALRFGDDRLVVKGETGFVCSPVGFRTVYAEYEPNRGPFVTVHAERPDDAEWRETPDGRRAILRDNGNRIEETVNAFLIVDGKGVVFPFRSTGVPIGNVFAHKATNLHVTYDGEELQGLAVGRWRFTGRLQRNGDFRWFVPVVTLAGRLGEPDGPTVDEWRLAMRARAAFRDGLDWEPANRPALPAPKDEPQPMSRHRRAAVESDAAKPEPKVDEIPW
jgi:hypothetical protein